MLAAAFALAACTSGQAVYSAALSYDVAEKLATAAIVSGAVNQRQAAAIKACDNVAYPAIAPVIAAERDGTSLTSSVITAAVTAEQGYEACISQQGVTLPAKGP